MRKTATTLLLLLLLLCAGCGSIVVNENYFHEKEFIRTNHGVEGPGVTAADVDAVMSRLPSEEKLAAMEPEERAATIERAVADATDAGEIDPSAQTSSAGRGTQNGGRGNVNFFIIQSGTSGQDVRSQVEAAIRAAGTVNSPSGQTDASGGDTRNKPPEDQPGG